MEFLTSLYERNLSYSFFNTARNELSPFVQTQSPTPFGQRPFVKRFLKGIYELRPCFPMHNSVWSVAMVFPHF